jgi:hypothetical protein
MPEKIHPLFIASCSPVLRMDHERHQGASLQASPHRGQRPRHIVLRLVAEGAVVVALLGSGWWGMSILGAHALASESSSAPTPVYVAGCPVGDTPQRGSAGEGCSKEGASHPISSRQPGAGLSEHAHGAEK